MREKLEALVAKWRREALANVPPEYADRGMHAKYLRCNVHAAGLDEAAYELEELLGSEPHD